ncbi:MAG: KEOPS complex subunit Pcc1 [Candidatus Bathyarchaeota archaeon]|nr:KEOPS complex subunit Pcc1 [Candidatus Bathyarchaeota archaeon]
MKAKATVCLKLNSEKHLATLLKALAPEAKKPATSRAKASLAADDCSLVLSVEAKDAVALRAALNAYLRWINSALKIIEVVDTIS